MAQVEVPGPSEAPIWELGATTSPWYEVGSGSRSLPAWAGVYLQYEVPVSAPACAHSGLAVRCTKAAETHRVWTW